MSKNIAMSMLTFATGVASAGSNNARRKMAKVGATRLLVEGATKSKKQALRAGYKAVDEIMQKDSYKLGAAVGNAKVFRGIADSFKQRELGASAFDAIRKGHMINGHMSATKIAGTAATIGVAGRVVTGGGLYRDRYGNFNLPGVPFI